MAAVVAAGEVAGGLGEDAGADWVLVGEEMG